MSLSELVLAEYLKSKSRKCNFYFDMLYLVETLPKILSLASAAKTRLDPIRLLKEADHVAVTIPTVTKGFHKQIPYTKIVIYKKCVH